jgi:PST family polysaccharide transporter
VITKLQNFIITNKLVIKNFTWLALLQIANYLIPLLIIPYVVRALGPEVFGKVSYAQNIIFYFTIIINYGFDYSATQAIAVNKHDKEKVSNIFWTVSATKAVLFCISFISMLVVTFSVSEISNIKNLVFSAFLINIGYVLFPIWYYQGIEKMSLITLFNFLIKVIGAFLIFTFVKKSGDGILYLTILSFAFILVGLISFLYTIRSQQFLSPTKIERKVIYTGFPIFLNNIFSNSYSAMGLTMLAFFADDYALGVYSGAYRLIIAILMIISYPLNTAIFPRLSKEFAISFRTGFESYKKYFIAVFIISLSIGVLIFFMSDFITAIILGNELLASAEVLKIFSVLPLLVMTASMLTVQGLYTLKLQKYAPYCGFTILSISIVTNYFLISNFGIFGAAYGYIISELLEIAIVSSLLILKIRKIKQQ